MTSVTLIHFLEREYGEDVIERLLEEMDHDGSSWGALERVTGKSIIDLDREFRRWGETHRNRFGTAQPWPYMQFYSPPIDPELRNAIRFSRERAE